MSKIAKVKIELLGVLRSILNRDFIEVKLEEGLTIGEVLRIAASKYEQLREAIDELGNLKTTYLLFINGKDVSLLGGNNYKVKDGDVLTLIPVSHGGFSSVREATNTVRTLINRIEKVRARYCLISGGNVDKIIDELHKYESDNCFVQILPSKIVISSKQLKLAAFLAFKAFEEGINISRSKHLEFLLYLFGDRQISKVLKALGDIQEERYVIASFCYDGEPSINFDKCVLISDEDLKLADLKVIAYIYDVTDNEKIFLTNYEEANKLVLTKIASLVLNV